MIANPVGLILFGVLLLLVAALGIIALFNRRLAGIGLLLLIGWVALEPVYLRAKYWVDMAWSGYDHYIDNGRAHFGVTLPADASLYRLPLAYLDNPYRGLRMVTLIPSHQITRGETRMEFSVIDTTPLDPPPDISDCQAGTTRAGLLVFAEDTCDALSWNSSATVYVTPPDAPVFAVFSLRETADDPSPKFYIRSAMLWHGSFLMNGRVHNVEIDDWRTTLTHLTRMLDTSFTALSPN